MTQYGLTADEYDALTLEMLGVLHQVLNEGEGARRG